jgi:hypothetical protein
MREGSHPTCSILAPTTSRQYFDTAKTKEAAEKNPSGLQKT